MKKRKVKVRASWRLDETYIKLKGIWCYLYRAVDKLGNNVNFLLIRIKQFKFIRYKPIYEQE
ncbi:DDE-type integrase/transposase/recombinase [Pseudomonas shirazensis]